VIIVINLVHSQPASQPTRSSTFILIQQVACSGLVHLESPVGSALASGVESTNSTEDASLSDDIPVPIQRSMELLTAVSSKYPGFVTPYIELHRCHLSLGHHDEALRCLRRILSLQPSCIPALVMIAKLEASRHNTSAAERALEQALSFDFSVRSVPLFRLVQLTVRAQIGRIEEAMTEAEALMKLPEVRSPGPEESPGRMHTDYLRLTDDDRVAAFVTLASQLGKARRLKEANKIISEAKVAFAGTPQEVHVLLASSQLAVDRKDYDTAIRMLDKIAEDSPLFARAQTTKAEILLNYTRDKEGYTKCYRRLVELNPTAKNYSLEGEAFMRILNPEEAVKSFNAAYALDRTNSALRSRIGKVRGSVGGLVRVYISRWGPYLVSSG